MKLVKKKLGVRAKRIKFLHVARRKLKDTRLAEKKLFKPQQKAIPRSEEDNRREHKL